MDLSKYKYFYVNGCSFTEGGGLEEETLFNTGVPIEYRKKYNVSWNNRAEINWGNRLADILKIQCKNAAKSGGSTSRVIRTTYDFIFENWKDKDKFFIILELPGAARADVFLNEINDYYIVNINIKDNNKLEYATREYFNKNYKEFDDSKQNIFKDWIKNHYNIYQTMLNNDKEIIGLYSFCKLNNIKIFLMRNTDIMFKNVIDKNDICTDILSFCTEKKLLIRNEVNNTKDGHPGYFGHIEYAKEIAKFLGHQIENKLL
jgi:hypothetical protein